MDIGQHVNWMCMLVGAPSLHCFIRFDEIVKVGNSSFRVNAIQHAFG